MPKRIAAAELVAEYCHLFPEKVEELAEMRSYEREDYVFTRCKAILRTIPKDIIKQFDPRD